MENNPIDKRMLKHNDYRREMQIRVLEQTDSNKMIIEGIPIVYDVETVLFKYEGIEYKEIIVKGAFDGADISKCYLKYNHSDSIMAMARVKNGTIKFETRDDGVHSISELADTTAGRDLYILAKRGDIDKMSFAFSIKEEAYDNVTHTWKIYKIDTVYDIAAVEQPAYDSTQLYARRYGDVEATRVKEAEALDLQRKRAKVRMLINN